MARAHHLLCVLLRRAQINYCDAPPALVALRIRRATARFPPRIEAEFANGYRTSVILPPNASLELSRHYGRGDPSRIEPSLLSDAQAVYAAMIGGDRASPPTISLREMVEGLRDPDRVDWIYGGSIAREPMAAEPGENRSRRDRWSLWWHNLSAIVPPRRPMPTSASRAEQRAIRLLVENLTAKQRRDYAKRQSFEVIGGHSGKRYRIRHGRQMNVDRLDRKGRVTRTLCFVPQGNLATGDVMLAQKVALELYEQEAIGIAINGWGQPMWPHP
jgi:hypothetical protein